METQGVDVAGQVLVTDDPDRFQQALRPADVLLYDSTGFDAGLVQWGDRAPVNHASLVLDGSRLIEANRSRGIDQRKAVRTEKTAERLTAAGVRTVTVLRHDLLRSADAPADAVLRWAHGQEGRGEFAYLEVVALAPFALRRAYRKELDRGDVVGKVMDLLLDLAEHLGRQARTSGSRNLSCSEFVYRCFEDAAGVDLPVRVDDPLESAPERPPWLTSQQEARLVALCEELHGQDRAVEGADDGPDGRPTRPDLVTPGDLWRSPDLIPVAVLHRPPERPPLPADSEEPL